MHPPSRQATSAQSQEPLAKFPEERISQETYITFVTGMPAEDVERK